MSVKGKNGEIDIIFVKFLSLICNNQKLGSRGSYYVLDYVRDLFTNY